MYAKHPYFPYRYLNAHLVLHLRALLEDVPAESFQRDAPEECCVSIPHIRDPSRLWDGRLLEGLRVHVFAFCTSAWGDMPSHALNIP